MPTVNELYNYFEEKFPVSLRLDWDNDGLMIADDPDREVYRILCTLDVTEEAVDHAVKHKCDLIVSHHPLIFRPLKALNYRDAKSNKIFKLISNKISVMSFHTRLDAASGGVNDVLAKLIGLEDVEVMPDGENLVRIGNLPITLSANEFASVVKKKLSADRVLFSNATGSVKRVAVCGGDGKDFVDAAKANGADTYLAGQLSYNIMAEANETGINLFEAGHFFTETGVCRFLTKLLQKDFTNVITTYFDSNRICSL